MYAFVYLDCIVVKIRQDKQVINKAIYLALGVNLKGHKELLGMWISENEGTKFWLGALSELQNRGIQGHLPKAGEKYVSNRLSNWFSMIIFYSNQTDYHLRLLQ